MFLNGEIESEKIPKSIEVPRKLLNDDQSLFAISDGKLKTLALFDKPDPLDGPYFEESYYISPSRLSDEVKKEINLSMVPEARVGDYVMVHVGVAISMVNEEEANKTFELLKQMGELNDLNLPETLG